MSVLTAYRVTQICKALLYAWAFAGVFLLSLALSGDALLGLVLGVGLTGLLHVAAGMAADRLGRELIK